MISLLFDGSILGRAQFMPLARSGIYRYTDQLLGALRATGRCQVTLTSFGYSLDAAGLSDYLAARPALAQLPVVLNPAVRLVGNGLRACMRLTQGGSNESASPSSLLRTLHQKGDGILASIQQQYRPGLDARLRGIEVFHTPFLHIPPVLRKIPRIDRIVTVHDLNPVAHPEYFPSAVVRWSRKVMQNIGPGDWVMTPSQFVKNDLCGRYPVRSDHVFVTPLAADDSIFYPCLDDGGIERVLARYNVPRQPFILTLGSLSPHKNVDHLVRCFGKVAQDPGAKDLNLVIAGTAGWGMQPLIEALKHSGSAAQRIHSIGFVRDQDQAALYTAATAFVFPSLCEGFGLPPLEAMQCGTPVICSNATSLPEVVGNAGILVDPDDQDALCQAILAIHLNPDLRQRLSRDGIVRSRRFSWQRCAMETLGVYEAAM